MAVSTDLIVAGLDFDTIRANLRNYISSKPEFTDYDFADSAMGTLLDLLAYNTYYNAFYANMATNESFLDTAQQYDSVVSHAKKLGYTPTSAKSATANVQLIFTNSFANTTFRSIIVPKNTKFSTVVNGSTYQFITPQTYTITANSSGSFSDYVRIAEGYPLTHRYLFNRNSNTSFVLPNENVDTSSITVSVNIGGNNQTYTLGTDITSINSSSQVYYVEADRQQKYKISFGDGVLGVQPATSSIVTVDYRVCSGGMPNGANNFTLLDTTIDGQSSIFIVNIGRASGGTSIEGIESIRFNAPRMYETQNRSVTKNDYERILLRENPDIGAISVWGGEENSPAIYGKVFVCAKPKIGTLFSYDRKEQIRNTIRKYNVQSIDTEIVDPSYLYIVPYIDIRYDPISTTKTPGELASDVAARVISFETNYLSTFGKKFRYSRFLEYMDLTNDSIVSTTAQIRMRKTFAPNLSSINTYNIRFNIPIQNLSSAGNSSSYTGFGCLTSSSFTYQNQTCYFDDNGYGTLRIYYRSGKGDNGRIYTNYNAGTIDYLNGIVTIVSFLPGAIDSDVISVFVAPVDPNITPIRNQIMLMSQSIVNIIDDSTNKVVSISTNIETIGQTAIILPPTTKLYDF
jgi:hypothetical protein